MKELYVRRNGIRMIIDHRPFLLGFQETAKITNLKNINFVKCEWSDRQYSQSFGKYY